MRKWLPVADRFCRRWRREHVTNPVVLQNRRRGKICLDFKKAKCFPSKKLAYRPRFAPQDFEPRVGVPTLLGFRPTGSCGLNTGETAELRPRVVGASAGKWTRSRWNHISAWAASGKKHAEEISPGLSDFTSEPEEPPLPVITNDNGPRENRRWKSGEAQAGGLTAASERSPRAMLQITGWRCRALVMSELKALSLAIQSPERLPHTQVRRLRSVSNGLGAGFAIAKAENADRFDVSPRRFNRNQ